MALANKESLIIGGALVIGAAKPGQLVPVDSEHSALAQAMRGERPEDVRKLIVTASGGPFRGRTRAELADVTPEQAAAHPTWDMGPVITINSATLVNKGLEVIEAHLLFDIGFDRIEVVVHPSSVVHSMVEFIDGATMVQASPPDMKLPIALGLAWPERVPDAAAGCDWTQPATWEFFPLDDEAFPAVQPGPHGRRRSDAPAPRCSTPPTRCASRRSSTGTWTSSASWTRWARSSTSTSTIPTSPARRCPSTACWAPTHGPGNRAAELVEQR